MERYKIAKKVVSRTITVPDPIDKFFRWMKDNGFNRSKLITDLLLKSPLYKQSLKDKQNE